MRIIGHPGDERFREQTGERWTIHLHQIRESAVDRILQRLLDRGMASAECEHPESGEEVEV
jgi:hypothetical protein